jgi:hypothetical protein
MRHLPHVPAGVLNKRERCAWLEIRSPWLEIRFSRQPPLLTRQHIGRLTPDNQSSSTAAQSRGGVDPGDHRTAAQAPHCHRRARAALWRRWFAPPNCVPTRVPIQTRRRQLRLTASSASASTQRRVSATESSRACRTSRKRRRSERRPLAPPRPCERERASQSRGSSSLNAAFERL